MLRWRNGTTHLALNQEIAGFKSRTEHGPIVYRLRSGTLNSGNRVQLPVGLLRGSQVRYGTGLITQRCAGSNPVPATKILNRGRRNP
jgi:hypothetical protein